MRYGLLLFLILEVGIGTFRAEPVWELTGSLGQARIGHTATLLADGKVLVVGGRERSHGNPSPLASAELFDPATGTWEFTGSLVVARYDHTATRLPSGKVLVVGGGDANAELYDPVAGTWALTASLPVARGEHTATLLASGRVLVAGGSDGSALASTELYDPTTGTWTPTGSLRSARSRHTATLLPSGDVLVAGGWLAGSELASAELYDPATGTWTPTGSLTTARMWHTATSLPSGKVLAAGGGGDLTPTSSAELYDPATGTWTPTDPLHHPRTHHTATLLAAGQVLVAGMENGTPATSAELYDPATATWTTIDPGASWHGIRKHTATLLPSGLVLVASGEINDFTTSIAALYAPSAGIWRAARSPTAELPEPTVTLLPSGQVLLVGRDGNLSSAELYDPAADTWTTEAAPTEARARHTATLLPSGEVLVAGGEDSALASAELFDPVTGTWRLTGRMQIGRSAHTATLLASGKLLVAGGLDSNRRHIADAELYDPATGTWTPTGALGVVGRWGATATLLHSGQVLVAGGCACTEDLGDGNPTTSAELYDPITGSWTPTGRLHSNRYLHTATLLPSGKVLVVGGRSSDPLGSSNAELYDPATGLWLPVDVPQFRARHTATLLPGGRVLLVGGDDIAVTFSSADIYDPSTGTGAATDILGGARSGHTATLLPSGEVLVVGGDDSGVPVLSAERYSPDSYPPERRPEITRPPSRIEYGVPFSITGTRFRGISEASGGNTRNSAVDFPLIQLHAVASDQLRWLLADPPVDFAAAEPITLTVSDLPPIYNPGWYLLTVVTAGVPSTSELVEVICSLAITEHPADQVVAVGSAATFEVKTQGGRRFQWQQDGIDILGATGPSYTTPPIVGADSGSTFRVRVDSGCTSVTSRAATLTVDDNEAPEAEVVSPSGGEYWLLSDADGPPNNELITWSMSDNVRICRVETVLLFSDDGGRTYQEAPAAGGLPAAFGPGGTCRHPGEGTTSTEYSVPGEPPSGSPGSLYKIELRVTDHAGQVRTVRSRNPFFIVRPNPDSVKTLILSNLSRMQDPLVMGIPPAAASGLAINLRNFADNPRTQGWVVDLGLVASLTNLYAAWDADPSNPAKANDVLFAPGGLHEYLREQLLPTYTGVEYLVLVGDDRIIPMARILDLTGLPETTYTDPVDADLTADGTTVGRALAANRYLSDDLLAVSTPVTLPLTQNPLASGGFLPDLTVGRLVENPDEIITTIATFISQGGILDLTALDPLAGHKVLVTGYDFLVDSGKKVRQRWKELLGAATRPEDLTPVDGQLLSATWDAGTVEERRDLLREHLAGNGGERYAINNLNGHATHFEEGVPGEMATDIQGLSASEIYGPHACASDPGIDLAGAVVYAVGCHGGLPVAGSCIDDADHSLDLPQTMMARGVVAYVANTGYGWGLKHGIGLSERLVEILTEEMTVGGTVVVGDAIRRSKLRYFLELPRFDVYDEKTLLQWTLFGLPMYAVRTGITAGSVATPGKAEAAIERPTRERFGAVKVERERIEVDAKSPPLPPYLTQLNVHFDLSAPGVYTKYDSEGDPITGPEPGCPDREGCYYTLNGLVERGTGTPDLPIQPYFIYDSRLSGTSQHGSLWMGGAYEEEAGWVPVIGELMSNGGDFSDHGSTPRLIRHRPRPRHKLPIDGETESCRASDLELNTLVVVAGEALKEESDPVYTRERLYRDLDLEILYFNDQGLGGNCDRLGPSLVPRVGGRYHQVVDSQIEWSVSANDEAGVWRVVVVYDAGPDASGRGRWEPLELENDGTGTWRGSRSFPEASRVTYMVQAVDRRGNVSWVEFETTDLPASGVPHDLPQPFDVALGDEPPGGNCVNESTAICLNGQRFRVEIDWRDFAGNVGSGRVVSCRSEDSGLFWFFDDQNWEVFVKVIDGCDFNDRFWVFSSATTNVEYEIRVTDTETGAVKRYSNPLGRTADTVLDTLAFATCP